MPKIHGGQVVARALKAEGVDAVFTLTGGHIVALLDGFAQEGVRVVDVRHEQAAAHAAEAYTRLTGKLGVAVVTAGPGVTDTITAVANAHYSSTPMMVIGGRAMIRQEQTGALQEMNHVRLLEPITRWSGTTWEKQRLAEYVGIAARHAFSGRGGPVFLDIPMDVQFDMVDEDHIAWPEGHRALLRAGLSDGDLAELRAVMASAERPMIFAGSGLWGGEKALQRLAEAWQAPVYLNSRARGSLSFDHELLGIYTRSHAFSHCDCVLALGVDWDFRSGYGHKIAPDAAVIQIDADGTKTGWNRPVDHGVVADPAMVLDQLAADVSHLTTERHAWLEEIRGLEIGARDRARIEADNDESPIMPQRFARDVAQFFGPDSIVAVDGGDIVSTTAKWLQTSTQGHLLDPGPFGTLGTGAPYAIAAKVAFPDKRVGIVFGDGGFGFNGFEYDTMVRHGLPIIGVVGNDGAWSNVKTFHRAMYPERVVAADLGRRPYHEVVAGLGGYGELVEEPSEIIPALERAEASGLPALVDVHLAETMRMSSNYSG